MWGPEGLVCRGAVGLVCRGAVGVRFGVEESGQKEREDWEWRPHGWSSGVGDISGAFENGGIYDHIPDGLENHPAIPSLTAVVTSSVRISWQ